jgi:hypothetical protein
VSPLATTRTDPTGLLYTTLASPIGELLLLGDGSSRPATPRWPSPP